MKIFKLGSGFIGYVLVLAFYMTAQPSWAAGLEAVSSTDKFIAWYTQHRVYFILFHVFVLIPFILLLSFKRNKNKSALKDNGSELNGN